MKHYDEEIAALARDAEITEARVNWFMIGMAAGMALTLAFGMWSW